jgi:predicted RNA binding protein YcfA (HicA-like mRNA interferase family)
MTKRQKRLQKIRQNPNNVSFDDLRQVLEDNGFELDHATGSHHFFRLQIGDLVLRVNIPFARPVKSRYVKQALKIIKQVQDAQSESDDTDTEPEEDITDESD